MEESEGKGEGKEECNCLVATFLAVAERVGSTCGVLHLSGVFFCLHGKMVLGKHAFFFSVFSSYLI